MFSYKENSKSSCDSELGRDDGHSWRYRRFHEQRVVNRLQDLLEANEGYRIVQQNGQRIFGPDPSFEVFGFGLPVPPKGCEIFIGNIPKHVYEDRLIPLLQTVGKLYKFRLMLDFNQKTRGYAFATYFNACHATQAIAKFNGYEILSSSRLAICKSVDNRRLFVGNIPRSKTREDVLSVFQDCVEGVADVIMYSTWQDSNVNRGFAFVEFESHKLASIARRQFHPRNMVAWDHALYIDWADPEPDVDPNEMAQVTVLYIKNLPHYYSHEKLHKVFETVAGGNLITRTHKIMTYAFVHCKNRASAERVMNRLSGLVLEDKHIELEWARPREYSTQYRALKPPQNCCLSVPLRSRRLVKEVTECMRSFSLGKSDKDSEPSRSPTSHHTDDSF